MPPAPPNDPKTTLTVSPPLSRASITLISTCSSSLIADFERCAGLLAVLRGHREQQRPVHEGAVERMERAALTPLLGRPGSEHRVEEVGRALLHRSGWNGAVVRARRGPVDWLGHRSGEPNATE